METPLNAELEKSYAKGYEDALGKKYDLAMARIIKSTKKLTLLEVKRMIRKLRQENAESQKWSDDYYRALDDILVEIAVRV